MNLKDKSPRIQIFCKLPMRKNIISVTIHQILSSECKRESEIFVFTSSILSHLFKIHYISYKLLLHQAFYLISIISLPSNQINRFTSGFALAPSSISLNIYWKITFDSFCFYDNHLWKHPHLFLFLMNKELNYITCLLIIYLWNAKQHSQKITLIFFFKFMIA